MWLPVVVEAYRVADGTAGVLEDLEAMPMRALLLERADDTHDHALLLRIMRRDEFLAQTIATCQCRIAAACEDQAIVIGQQERLGNTPQCAKPGDQRMLQRAACRASTAAARYDASRAVRACGSRSPAPAWPSHRGQPRHGIDRWTRARRVRWRPRATPESVVESRSGAS